MSENNKEIIEIKLNKSSYIGIGFFCIVVGAAMVAGAFIFFSHPIASMISAGAGLLFVLVGIKYYLINWRPVSFRLDSHGIERITTRETSVKIAWENIERISVPNDWGLDGWYVGIRLKDPERHLSSLSNEEIQKMNKYRRTMAHMAFFGYLPYKPFIMILRIIDIICGTDYYSKVSVGEEAKSYEASLKAYRQAFGFDILIHSSELDRSVDNFAHLISGMQQKAREK